MKTGMLVGALLICACFDSPVERETPRRKNIETKETVACLSEGYGAGDKHPLAIPYTEVGKGAERVGDASCVDLDLKIEDSKSILLYGHLVIANHCKANMAILADPAQVYVRNTKSDFFVPETMVDPAYVVLYIFKADLGIGPSAFLGDGGLEVYGWPTYLTVPAGAVVNVPLVDRNGLGRKLTPGEYGARLSTWAAPTSSARGASSIDLGLDVARFNQECRSERVGISLNAGAVVSNISTFHVSRTGT